MSSLRESWILCVRWPRKRSWSVENHFAMDGDICLYLGDATLTCGENNVWEYVSDSLGGDHWQFQQSYIFCHREDINLYLHSPRVSPSQLQLWLLIVLRNSTFSNTSHMPLLRWSRNILTPTLYFPLSNLRCTRSDSEYLQNQKNWKYINCFQSLYRPRMAYQRLLSKVELSPLTSTSKGCLNLFITKIGEGKRGQSSISMVVA